MSKKECKCAFNYGTLLRNVDAVSGIADALQKDPDMAGGLTENWISVILSRDLEKLRDDCAVNTAAEEQMVENSVRAYNRRDFGEINKQINAFRDELENTIYRCSVFTPLV